MPRGDGTRAPCRCDRARVGGACKQHGHESHHEQAASKVGEEAEKVLGIGEDGARDRVPMLTSASEPSDTETVIGIPVGGIEPAARGAAAQGDRVPP